MNNQRFCNLYFTPENTNAHIILCEILHRTAGLNDHLGNSLQLIIASQIINLLVLNVGNFDKWFPRIINLPGSDPG